MRNMIYYFSSPVCSYKMVTAFLHSLRKLFAQHCADYKPMTWWIASHTGEIDAAVVLQPTGSSDPRVTEPFQQGLEHTPSHFVLLSGRTCYSSDNGGTGFSKMVRQMAWSWTEAG